ncbi:hypothetical protein EJ06DRAFT_471089 [Trichodelitschia bisporula]|uniref:RlpA-like protein double-psi beta-barrel domain-containing protein n=1 Tax=Trichodelitschia bisporula TaxID=703511 RepID=A0A6G1I601_9PEZI|nr:hypothetical protein EJ06DRAFT_471089 [Trichodelitschia bisporula]
MSAKRAVDVIPDEALTRKPRRSPFTAISDKFNQVFPPYRTYLGRSRKFMLCAAVGTLFILFGLIIGLAVGLTQGSHKTKNLPLPSNAEKHTGDLTYYEPGLGACGITSSSSENIVAISYSVFDAVQVGSNPNANPLCGKKLRATRFNDQAGSQRSVDLTVVDRCVGCKPTDIDTTTSVFKQLANIDQGRVLVTWAWLDVQV